MVDRWVNQASGWALCDDLGSGPISAMLHKDSSRSDEILRWTKSENFWRRRITLYALRDFVFAKELDFPFVVLERLLYDEESWVQRAVGTWLRECWRKDRKRTEEFLLKNSKGLPKVVCNHSGDGEGAKVIQGKAQELTSMSRLAFESVGIPTESGPPAWTCEVGGAIATLIEENDCPQTVEG